jgi:hypothetical protein
MPNGMGRRVVLVHTNRPVEVWDYAGASVKVGGTDGLLPLKRT